jgi:hypothetical protein
MLGTERHDLAGRGLDVALPIELDPVVAVEAGLGPGADVAAAVVGEAQAEGLVEDAVEEHLMGGTAGEQLARIALTLLRRPTRWERR